MELLLHTCCGPCAIYATEHLIRDGFSPIMYYHNPNIHPYQEWTRRRDSLKKLAEVKKLPLLIDEDYQMPEFLRRVAFHEEERCGFCYEMRLSGTSQKALESGVQWFSSTLLISPYQNRELLCRIGKETAEKYGLRFYDADLRPGFRRSQLEAKEMGLYRQGYCGCIYSERDRYYRSAKKQE